MAYNASNNNNNQQQVAGSNPLASGSNALAAQPAPSQDQNNAPTSNSSTSAIQGAASTQVSPQQSPQDSKPASSGMFTNIQKYVSKNKPQAQKMATAVKQDFGKKAQQINTATQDKRKEQKQALATATNQLSDQRSQAQTTVDTVTSDSKFKGLQDDQMQSFQSMFRQGPETQEVGALDLVSQTNKASALQKLADKSEREKGRKALMQQTFGDRQYTKGQSDLDNLILGGDTQAREDLIKGVKGEAGVVQSTIKEVTEQSRNDLSNLRGNIDSFKGDLQDMLNQGSEGLSAKALAERNALISNRKAQALEMEKLYADKLQGQADTFKKLGSMSDGEMYDWFKDQGIIETDEVLSGFLGRSARADQALLDEALGRGGKVKVGDSYLDKSDVEDIFLNRQYQGADVDSLFYNTETGEYQMNPELSAYRDQSMSDLDLAMASASGGNPYKKLEGLEAVYGYSDQGLYGDDFLYKDTPSTMNFGNLKDQNWDNLLEKAIYKDNQGLDTADLLSSYYGDDYKDIEDFTGRQSYTDSMTNKQTKGLRRYLSDMSKKLGDDKFIQDIISREVGTSYDDLISGKDILSKNKYGEYTLADQDTINRENALRRLANRQDIMDTKTFDRSYTDSGDIYSKLKARLGSSDRKL